MKQKTKTFKQRFVELLKAWWPVRYFRHYKKINLNISNYIKKFIVRGRREQDGKNTLSRS